MAFDMDTDMIRLEKEDRNSYVLNVMDGHLGLQSTDLRQSVRHNVPGLR